MKKTIYSGPTNKRPKCETPLRQWMDDTGTSAFALAKEMGKVPSHIRYWADGQSLPSLVDAFKLEKLTAGKVAAASWLGTDLAKTLWNNRKVQRG